MPTIDADPCATNRPLRGVIDTSTLYTVDYRKAISSLGPAGSHRVAPIACLRTAEELTRVLLYVKRENQGKTPLSPSDYRKFSDLMDALIDHVDDEYEVGRYHAHAPSPAEAAWAAATDPKDLYLQQLARALNADYVVSANKGDFPNRRTIGNYLRGELEGVIWIQPKDFFECFDAQPPIALPTISPSDVDQIVE